MRPPRCHRASIALASEAGEQFVEEFAASGQAYLVALVQQAQAVDLRGETGRFGATELGVLDVDIVNQFGQSRQTELFQLEADAEHLERAAITFVRELGLEHVEAEL